MANLPMVVAANAPSAVWQMYKRRREISPAAATAARFFVENNEGISKAARSIQGVFRRKFQKIKFRRPVRVMRGVPRSRKPAANQPYHDNGHDNSFDVKFSPGIAGYKGVVQKALDVYEMKIPALGQGSDNRLTNRIFLKGFHVCTQIFNRKTFPVVVQMALLQFPRRETGDDPEPKDKFFRADENGDEGNALSFQDFNENPGWDMRYICNALNPDNKRVLMRKKWILGSRELNGNKQPIHQAGYMVMHDRYIRINRHIVLNGSADVNEQPFYMVFWALPLDSNDHNTTETSTHFAYNMRVKTLWRNVV